MIFIELFNKKGEKYVINPERIQYMTYDKIKDRHTSEISYRTSIRFEDREYVVVAQTPEEIIKKIEQAQMDVIFKAGFDKIAKE